MKITIDTPNSPGTMFNETTDEYIFQTYSYLEKKKDNFSETYKDFQKHALSFTTESYIRNIFPFLKNAKVVNDYKTVTKKLFTELGKAYFLCIDSLKKCKLEHETQGIRQFENLKQGIVRNGLTNIIQNKKVLYGKIFHTVLKHLNTYERIDEKEFALILYILQNNLSAREYQSAMEQDEIDFSVRVTNKGTTSIKKETKITCFSYFMGSLISAGIVSKKDKSGFYQCICNSKTIEAMI